MSPIHEHESHDGAPSAIGALQTRLAELFNSCDQRARQTERRRKVLLICGVSIVLLCVASLSRATFLVGELDAQTLTQIGRLEIERQLPASRQALSEHLRRGAPEFVQNAILASLRVIPVARERLVSDVDAGLEGLIRKHEDDLVRTMVAEVRASKRSIDAALEGSSDEEKLEALIVEVTRRFEANVDACLSALEPEFHRELDRVETFLGDLGTVDDARLTRRERLQKELVQTFLALIASESSTAGD